MKNAAILMTLFQWSPLLFFTSCVAGEKPLISHAGINRCKRKSWRIPPNLIRNIITTGFSTCCLVDTGKREYIGLSCGYKMNLRSVSGGQKSASHFLMGHRSIGIAVLAIR